VTAIGTYKYVAINIVAINMVLIALEARIHESIHFFRLHCQQHGHTLEE